MSAKAQSCTPSSQSGEDRLPRTEMIIANLCLLEPFLVRKELATLYDTLDPSKKEIRILRLHGYGDPDGLIHCSLQTKSLLDDIKYSAISYVWGDPTERVELACGFIVVRVTKGLHSVLANLRKQLETKDDWLDIWIDGLCINQQDLDERSSQVLLMGRIYKQSHRTIVWLGEEANDSDRVMASIRKTGRKESLDPSNPRVVAGFSELWDPRFWEALNEFFCRPFWGRMWVLQEIALSPDIVLYCGQEEVSWQFLEKAQWCWAGLSWKEPWKHFSEAIADAITTNSNIRVNVFRQIKEDVIESGKTGETGTPILVHLIRSLELQSTDPRDKIYALLGVSSDNAGHTPDYKASVRHVYTDFLSKKLAHGFNTLALYLAGSGVFRQEHKTCDLPSWVCDFAAWSTRSSDGAPFYPACYFYQRTCFNAARGSESTIRTIPASNLLWTRGVCCDKITKCTESATILADDEFWEDLAHQSESKKYLTGIPLLQAAFRTLLFDNNRKEMKPLQDDRKLLAQIVAGFFLHLYLSPSHFDDPAVAEVLVTQKLKGVEAFQRWQKRCAKDANKKLRTMKELFLGETWQDLDLDSIHDEVSPFASYILAHDKFRLNTNNGAFFRTEKGYFGLGPLLTRPGEDEVFVLPGMEMPFVMRSKGTHYELVGPCFVMGLMKGEAMDLVDSGERSLQNLVVL